MPITTIDGADGSSLSILLYGVIDEFWGVSAEEFAPILFAADKRGLPQIDLRIASRGGDVMAALSMHSAIQACGTRVVAHIDGIAASAASVVAMAADEIVIGENSYLMVHDPWGVSVGTAEDMRESAKLLDGISENVAEMYAKRSGQKIEAVVRMMGDETWMLGGDAVELGFADRVAGDKATIPAQSQADAKMMRSYKRAPQALLAGEIMPRNNTAAADAPPALAAVEDTKPADAATPSDDDGVPADEDQPKLADTVVAAEPAPAYPHAEVLDVCLLAGHAEMARGFFADQTPLADVRAKLLDIKAAEAARDAISTQAPRDTAKNCWDGIIAKASAANGAGR